MPTPSTYLTSQTDPASFEHLPRLSGVILLIDIASATGEIANTPAQWLPDLLNLFRETQSSHSALRNFQPLKCIGDSLLFIIEQDDLQKQNENILSVYDAIHQLLKNLQLFPKARASLVYSHTLLPVTFLKHQPLDYYSPDIIFATRLISNALPGEIWLNQTAFDIMQKIYADNLNEQYDHIQEIAFIDNQDVADYPYTAYYVANVFINHS